MADQKISALAEVTDLLTTDEFVLARSGTTKKITGDTLAGFLGGEGDGWQSDPATWTYASASTFTVSGDVTAKFHKGTRLKFTQTTVKYAVVVASSHSSGTTTVTIAVNDDYTLANAAITDNYYSYALAPQGYPGWFNFSPTVGGFSSAPSDTCRYRIDGPTCTLYFDNFNAAGSSNATTFTVTAPVTPALDQQPFPIQHANSGSGSTSPGMARTSSVSATLSLFTNWNAGTWTNSGTKWARFTIQFQF